MKNLKISFINIIISILLIFGSTTLSAQNNNVESRKNKSILIKNMLDSQRFIFIAQSVSPLRGGFRNLNSYFDMKILKDTLISDLPYFGRAYTAQIGSSTGPLDFVSKNITYSISPSKKHSWAIILKPKDIPDIQQYLLTVYDNGSANLSVTSNSRDPISFNGYVSTIEGKRKNRS